jgi:hypothetical protein
MRFFSLSMVIERLRQHAQLAVFKGLQHDA